MIDYKEPIFLIVLILAVSLIMQVINFIRSIFQHLRKKNHFAKPDKTEL